MGVVDTLVRKKITGQIRKWNKREAAPSVIAPVKESVPVIKKSPVRIKGAMREVTREDLRAGERYAIRKEIKKYKRLAENADYQIRQLITGYHFNPDGFYRKDMVDFKQRKEVQPQSSTPTAKLPVPHRVKRGK